MIIGRRRFVFGSLAAAATAACGSKSSSSPQPGPVPKPEHEKPAPKKILILGGTGFIGPHIINSAIARGHTMTMFNRGKTRPELFPDVEKLHGDRDGKLDELKGHQWDAVVDTSGYVPRIVKMSAELLAPNVKQYIFISSISVYAPGAPVGADESAPVEKLLDPTSEDIKGNNFRNYGALKALSEQAAETAMPGRTTAVRPGLIIGPGDMTGRFTHWPTRLAEGGDVLCPGDGSTPVQYIDGRDLADWIVKLIETNALGTMNALGPETKITMKEVIDSVNTAAGNKANPVWVDAKFLDKHEVSGWAEMPMWIPNEGEDAGFGTLSNARAVKTGLRFRPIADTAKDTLAWLATLPEDERKKYRSSGIKREKEDQVLAAWKAEKKG
ncbi:MAG TPA: NAD-dependent epimerase/dehydratase family protein [Kofleriaceae bacterium]|nr:NAD-dependent epimerase/dehydratase family protein [Kofleriaceae bacterium]